MTAPQKSQKPLLRGYLHQEAFFVSLGACALLIAGSTTTLKLIASLVYSFGLFFLFGISAIYHVPTWEKKPRALLKRFDHSAIFILIAGTFTPVCLLGLPESKAFHLLTIVWLCTLAGIGQSIFWVTAPKWFTALLYVGLGWTIFPYINDLKVLLSPNSIILIFAGGIAYSVGAACYALKKPTLNPQVFGYHEVFHALTIIGAALHFIVVYRLIN